MKFNRYYLIFQISFLFFSCSEEPSKTLKIEKDSSYSYISNDYHLSHVSLSGFLDSVHFRGLSKLGNTYFISGTDGKILFKDNDLTMAELYQAKYTDLRDIHVLSDSSILVMGIASPGHIWKINKGDREWRKVYTNMDTLVFMDGMDFWNDSVGLVFGDPLDGYHFILKTVDAGESWIRIPKENLPARNKVEAGFAASGTSIVCVDSGIAYIGLGGEKARVLITNDYGETWEVSETPILHGNGGKGIYSMAFKDALNGVIVGGNWEDIKCDSSKAFTNDGGKTWLLASGIQHYRSCVTFVGDSIYIATGTSGTDISYDNGKSWSILDSVGYNTILFLDRKNGLGVGSNGVIDELKLN